MRRQQHPPSLQRGFGGFDVGGREDGNFADAEDDPTVCGGPPSGVGQHQEVSFNPNHHPYPFQSAGGYYPQANNPNPPAPLGLERAEESEERGGGGDASVPPPTTNQESAASDVMMQQQQMMYMYGGPPHPSRYARFGPPPPNAYAAAMGATGRHHQPPPGGVSSGASFMGGGAAAMAHAQQQQAQAHAHAHSHSHSHAQAHAQSHMQMQAQQYGRYPVGFAGDVARAGASFHDGIGDMMSAQAVTSTSGAPPSQHDFNAMAAQQQQLYLQPAFSDQRSAQAHPLAPIKLERQGEEEAAAMAFRSPPQDRAEAPMSAGWGSEGGGAQQQQQQQNSSGDDEDAGAPSSAAKAPPFASAAMAAGAESANGQQQRRPRRLPSPSHPAEKWHRQHGVPRETPLPIDVRDAEAVRRLSPSDRTWIHRFQDLRAFKAAHGHCNVPRVFPANPSLASWVHNQRKDYKRLRTNRKSAMTEMRIRHLEDMGFEWNQQGANWDRRLEELKAYKAANGHTNVPQRYGENAALGRWVNTQRLQQRLRKQGQNSDMTDDRYDRLCELGFVWYVKGPDQWMDRFHELEAYKNEFGNCDVPSRYTPNRRLGRWVSFQRTQYRLKQQDQHNHLTDSRMRALEKLGFSWTAPGQQSTAFEAMAELRPASAGKRGGGKKPSPDAAARKGGEAPPSVGVLGNKSAPPHATKPNAAAAMAMAMAAPATVVGGRKLSLPGLLETSASSLDASELMKTSASTLDVSSPAESAAELLKTAELQTSSDDDEENDRMEDIQEEPFSNNSSPNDGGSSSSPDRGGESKGGRETKELDGKRHGASKESKSNGKKFGDDGGRGSSVTGGFGLPGGSSGSGAGRGDGYYEWTC